MLDSARPGTKGGLSAELIASKALEIVDEAGYDALSFRVLGRAVGCEAMSIYHYFGSKADLRDALIERVMCEAGFGPDHDAPWTDQIAAAADRLRYALLAHPALVPVLACAQGDCDAVARWQSRLDEIAEDQIPDAEKRAARLGMVWNYVIGTALGETCGGSVSSAHGYRPGLDALITSIAADAGRDRVQSIREARRARRRDQSLQ